MQCSVRRPGKGVNNSKRRGGESLSPLSLGDSSAVLGNFIWRTFPIPADHGAEASQNFCNLRAEPMILTDILVLKHVRRIIRHCWDP